MKAKTIYSCQECGAQSQKWLGRCPECEAWNSLVEERPVPTTAGAGAASASAGSRYALAGTAGPQLYEETETAVCARSASLGPQLEEELHTLVSAGWTRGIDELDRVLGGGVVPGSLVLIGGEP